MKTTTKVLIGVLAGLPLLFVGTLIFLSTLSDYVELEDYALNDSTYVTTTLSAAHTLEVSRDDNSRKTWNVPEVRVLPLSDSVRTPQLRVPESQKDNISVSEQDGVLSISFLNLDELAKKNNAKRIGNAVCTLYMDAGTLRELRSTPSQNYSYWNHVQVKMTGWKGTDLTCNGAIVELVLDNGSQLSTLHVNKSSYLRLDSCTIDTLALNLDDVNSWRVHNCRINVEQLSAGKRASVYAPRSEAKRVEWYPQSKDAVLSLDLSGTPAIIEYTDPK
jgi:hypothetical protein